MKLLLSEKEYTYFQKHFSQFLPMEIFPIKKILKNEKEYFQLSIKESAFLQLLALILSEVNSTSTFLQKKGKTEIHNFITRWLNSCR